MQSKSRPWKSEKQATRSSCLSWEMTKGFFFPQTHEWVFKTHSNHSRSFHQHITQPCPAQLLGLVNSCLAPSLLGILQTRAIKSCSVENCPWINLWTSDKIQTFPWKFLSQNLGKSLGWRRTEIPHWKRWWKHISPRHTLLSQGEDSVVPPSCSQTPEVDLQPKSTQNNHPHHYHHG